MQKIKISGQSLTEFALCLAAVTAAIIGIQFYVQRSLMARYKGGVDYTFSTIEREAAAKGNSNLSTITRRQYDPYYLQSQQTTEERGETVTGYPRSSLDRTTNRYGWGSIAPTSDAD